ncbi:hypothetical protein G6O69_15655 [Pseudenhygromyxa sp. WMMC2535]|uniref:hypothetical protein n=1 Tax=Pseudenhygromyxa sp. WMMC2535 TaxID=2712867 RepID=UPI00159571A4|nr:hypothetical protein [Pseudenhygromyxa sp. WMMC2535]NVB39279.1 hypothetical protein [Pseudenhygromyxa sp. WMMC2535]
MVCRSVAALVSLLGVVGIGAVLGCTMDNPYFGDDADEVGELTDAAGSDEDSSSEGATGQESGSGSGSSASTEGTDDGASEDGSEGESDDSSVDVCEFTGEITDCASCAKAKCCEAFEECFAESSTPLPALEPDCFCYATCFFESSDVDDCTTQCGGTSTLFDSLNACMMESCELCEV